MPPDSDITRVRHMVESARAALEYSAGVSRADLDANRMLVHAIVRTVEIVGEAAFHVGSETRQSLPQVPWENIIGMRHRRWRHFVTRYHINLSYCDEDQAWVADISDLGACSALGTTPEEALSEVERAKVLWLTAAREAGKAVPPPRYRPAIYQAR